MFKHCWERSEAGWVKFNPKEPMTYPDENVLIQVQRPSRHLCIGKRHDSYIVAIDRRWDPLPVKKIIQWREVK